MSKGIFSFFFVLGFIFFIIGLLSWYWLWGLAVFGFLLMIAAAGGAFYFGVIRSEEVMENWSILIEDGRGRGNEVLDSTSKFLRDTEVQNVSVERRMMAPGIVKGILGEEREFLVVKPSGLKLAPYQIFLNARDYGKNLHVSWYLTYRIGVLRAILGLIPGLSLIPRFLSDLDLFEQQDLTAYVTNVHRCTLKAVEKLMLELNQDPSKIDRKTRGFLGVS
ncbi:MAG: hypothetical protein QXI39_07850 [Candidatus Bathyarchaeia archaeon]